MAEKASGDVKLGPADSPLFPAIDAIVFKGYNLMVKKMYCHSGEFSRLAQAAASCSVIGIYEGMQIVLVQTLECSAVVSSVSFCRESADVFFFFFDLPVFHCFDSSWLQAQGSTFFYSRRKFFVGNLKRRFCCLFLLSTDPNFRCVVCSAMAAGLPSSNQQSYFCSLLGKWG